MHANRFVDPGQIGAIGFDLDHTLAVYDDDEVNRLACEETARLLIEHLSYDDGLLDSPYDGASVARGIGIEFETGAVVKLDEDRRVGRAFRGGNWISDLDRLFPHPVAPTGIHELHSPFDLPTGWLFMTLGAATPQADGAAHAQQCHNIRMMLDRSHTRGELKRRVLEDIGRFVRPLHDPDSFARLRDGGRRLFVLTNSEYDYALALLDFLFDGATSGSWRDLFDAVVVSAAKPGFFDSRVSPREAKRAGRVIVFKGGCASALEVHLGAQGAQVLYAGDHAEYDVAAAARSGWRTAHILPELSRSGETQLWGSVFRENGRLTWFSRLVLENADLFTDHVEALVPGICDGAIVPGLETLHRDSA